MEMMSNEQLCILAQQGDVAAQNLLIENNLSESRAKSTEKTALDNVRLELP